MASVYENLLRQINQLENEINSLKIMEGAGAAGGGIIGSGITNRIAQWSGAASLTSSTLIKTGVGVLTIDSDTDYTLTVPGTGTVLLEATAATTYLKLDASNDPLTSGLAITGSADEIQLVVKANGTQNANLVEFQNSVGFPTLYVTSNNDLYFSGKTAFFEDASTPINAWRSGGTSTMLYTVYTDNTTNGGRIRLQGAGGTMSSPTPVLNNYTIGELQAFGYINGAFRQMFVMRAAAVNTISSTSYPTNVYFIVTLQGATTGTTMMTLHNSGYVGVNTGTGTPRGMLGVIARAATDVGLSVKGASSQSADLMRWEDSGNNTISLVDANGGMVINETGGASADFRAETDTETNMIFNDASADTLYLGGSTNGIKITKGGELTLIGTATVWDDLRVEPTARNTGAKAPTFANVFGGLYLYAFDDAVAGSEKEIFFNLQLSHQWKEGSTISPHVHWINEAAGTAGQVVRWGLEYSKATIGGTFSSSPTTIYGTTIAGGGDITVQYEHMITELDDITMTGDTLSTVLICRLFRNSSDAADTYTGTAGILYIDFHVEINRMGSQTEFA